MSSAAAAKAVSKVSSPPSTFSSLLRQSKFASYDPKIGQVYATYGGSVHRGDWGLKRPLAIRRSDTRVTIGNLDTIYQQTEWDNASTDAMVIQKFEELKLTPRVVPSGTWAPRVGHSNAHSLMNYMHDADYVDAPEGKREALLETMKPVPNPIAMNEKRFERYIRRARRLRADFEPYVQALEEERLQKLGSQVDGDMKIPNSIEQAPYQLKARREAHDHSRFLADKLAEVYDAKDSTAIRPFPHPNAGLSYVHAAELQTALSSGPVPGRALHSRDSESNNRDATSKDVDVALAGWVASFKPDAPLNFTDFGRDDAPRVNKDSGKGLYKPSNVEIVHVPNVVGKQPERISAQRWEMKLMGWEEERARASMNMNQPGSVDYITHEISPYNKRYWEKSSQRSGSSNRRKASKWIGKEQRKDNSESIPKTKGQAKGVLSSIHSMIPNRTKDSDITSL